MTRNRLLLLVPTAVVLAAVVSGTTAVYGVSTQNQSTSCTCTTVEDGQSNPVNVAVVVNGSDASSASISQQTVQTNDRTRVDIDVEFDDESLTISGESAENGSLVFDVTRNDTVVNESIVVNGSENQSVVFYVDSDHDEGVRVTREKTAACPCETNVDVGNDAGGVQVNVSNGGVEVNVGGDDSCDSEENEKSDCASSCTCSESSTELSHQTRRGSVSLGTGVSLMRAVVRPSDLVGLAMPGRTTDCEDEGTDCSGE